MTPHARQRQNRYRQRKKEAGYHRLEVWVPADVMSAIERRFADENGYYWPQPRIVELLRKALRLPAPPKPWERHRTFPPP